MSTAATKRPVTMIEPGTVKLERLLPGPVDRVWAYITESDKRAKWLAAGEFELRIGGKARLEFNNANLSAEKAPESYTKRNLGQFDGVITRLEPMRLLAHTWTWNGGDTEVTYELTPQGKQALLTIVHRRLPDNKELSASVMGGWEVHSGILEDVLNGVEPRPFFTTHTRVQQQYAEGL